MGVTIHADKQLRKPTLNAKQEVALDCLLSGGTISEAATRARVSRQTASGWANHDDAFLSEWQRRREERAKAVRAELQSAATEAVDALLAVVRDPTANASDRVKAATAILDRCGLTAPKI